MFIRKGKSVVVSLSGFFHVGSCVVALLLAAANFLPERVVKVVHSCANSNVNNHVHSNHVLDKQTILKPGNPIHPSNHNGFFRENSSCHNFLGNPPCLPPFCGNAPSPSFRLVSTSTSSSPSVLAHVVHPHRTLTTKPGHHPGHSTAGHISPYRTKKNHSVITTILSTTPTANFQTKKIDSATSSPTTTCCNNSMVLTAGGWACRRSSFLASLLLSTGSTQPLDPAIKVVDQQLSENESALRSLLVDMLCKLGRYLRSMVGLYCLGVAALLPHCSLSRLQRVHLDDPYLLSYHGLPGNACPGSFGLPYTDLHLPLRDSSGGFLRGWLVPAEDVKSRKVVLCIHGWFSNRQSCLPFLDKANKMGLVRDHHIVLLDMRNAGESSALDAPDLGVYGSRDLYDVIAYLHEELNIDSVSLYAQSLGCMSSLLLMDSHEKQLEALGVRILNVVLDSPLSNAAESIRTLPGCSSLARRVGWVYDILLWILDQRQKKQLSRLRLSYFLNRKSVGVGSSSSPPRVLVLHSAEDSFAPWHMVASEVRLTARARRPLVYLFENGRHANIAKTNAEDYEKLLSDFLCPSFWRRLFPHRLSSSVSKIPSKTFDEKSPASLG